MLFAFLTNLAAGGPFFHHNILPFGQPPLPRAQKLPGIPTLADVAKGTACSGSHCQRFRIQHAACLREDVRREQTEDRWHRQSRVLIFRRFRAACALFISWTQGQTNGLTRGAMGAETGRGDRGHKNRGEEYHVHARELYMSFGMTATGRRQRE